MRTKIQILQHQRGLHFRNGDMQRLLTPGTYRFWSKLWSRQRDTVEIVDTLTTRFEHKRLDYLLEEPTLRDQLLVVDLADNERALLWKDERLVQILGPGRYAYWRVPYRLRVETFDVNALRFTHKRLETILAHASANAHLSGVDVADYEDVLLFRNGALIDKLEQGRHVYWKGAGRITWKSVDKREQQADVAGQEIMTRDKVTLRVNLLLQYRVVDTVKAVTEVSDYAQTLYREAQLALRAAVGTRSLDQLLADKESVSGEVRNALAPRANEFGVSLISVGLRDIILPGEMKLILNQVIEAEKQAQANLIRRREETAAARSQANTAKLLAENPELAKMKELELLQDILRGSNATFVFGNAEIAEQIRSLAKRDVR